MAVISVEPEPDNSMGPFTLKPLMDRVIDDIGEGVLQPMSRNPAALPSGHAALLHETMIPGGANVVGFGGARWFSDLDVANMGGMPSMVTIQLLAADQANTTPESVSFSLAPGMSVRYRDAFAELFDFEGSGALRILVDSPYVTISSRTYAADEDGSYGQGIPAHNAVQAISYGRAGRLVGLSESGNTSDGFRTNIGMVNATGTMTTVVVELYSSDDTSHRHHRGRARGARATPAQPGLPRGHRGRLGRSDDFDSRRRLLRLRFGGGQQDRRPDLHRRSSRETSPLPPQPRRGGDQSPR